MNAFQALGDRDGVVWSLLHLAIVAFGEGELDRAEALGRECFSLAGEIGDAEAQGQVALHLALVACARDEPAQASAWFHDVVRFDTVLVTDLEGLARYLAGVAVLASTCGEAERAARLFGAAEARRAEVGLALAWPERGVYEQAAAAARATLGEAAFAETRAAGRANGPAAALADLEAVLTATGGSLSAASVPLARERLTPREAEVLRLLVAGKTNPEIADMLFISPRTATTHVTNILGKLGVASRTEAAAWAVRQGLA